MTLSEALAEFGITHTGGRDGFRHLNCGTGSIGALNEAQGWRLVSVLRGAADYYVTQLRNKGGTAVEAEPFHAGEEGWCEWHHPGKGPGGVFVMECCGCALQHDVEFKVHGKVDVPADQAWPGEKKGAYLVWRLRQRA